MNRPSQIYYELCECEEEQ